MTRTPPSDIRKQLRQEVNFGCPVKDCGNPYLFWHHFDPPFAEKEHHNPEGMIALCAEHHDKADAGAFTKEDLQDLKKNPQTQEVSGRFDWMRQQLVANIGGSIHIEPQVLLEINDEKVVWFNRDEQGRFLLNMAIPSPDGKIRLAMDNNAWTITEKPADLQSPPKGRELVVKYDDGQTVTIEFLNIADAQTFKKLYQKDVFDELGLNFPLTAVNLTYKDPARKLVLDFDKGILPGNNVIFGGFIESRVAYKINL